MNAKIINLTPHKVTIVNDDNTIKAEFESQGIARCSQQTTLVGNVNGINITSTVFGDVTDLPDEKPNTFFIVSRLVLNACKGTRSDLLVPNELIRDDNGNIIGCKSFAIN